MQGTLTLALNDEVERGLFIIILKSNAQFPFLPVIQSNKVVALFGQRPYCVESHTVRDIFILNIILKILLYKYGLKVVVGLGTGGDYTAGAVERKRSARPVA